MESSNDKILQLEEESLQDDNTSCTSSLGTSVSEEPDDLHLGAEANSFGSDFMKRDDVRRDGYHQDRGNKVVTMFLSKAVGSFDSDRSTGQTLSTITSVSDLIAARECDAEDILFNLGFAATSEDENRKNILSRFSHGSVSRPDDEFDASVHNKHHPEHSSITPQSSDALNESIHKTQEWLAHRHQQQQHHPSVEDVSEDVLKQSKANVETPNTTKRASVARVAKLRRRQFSKSRQSSFELLLPNLQEEEVAADVTQNVRVANDADDPECAPISGSLVEQQLNKPEPNTGLLPETPISEKFPQPKIKEPAIPPHVSLASAQLESFELEEINSNEDPADAYKLRQMSPVRANLSRRIGVVQMPHDLAPPSSSSAPQSRSGTPSESDENETSSGFDESDPDHVHDRSDHGARVTEKKQESGSIPCCGACGKDGQPCEHRHSAASPEKCVREVFPNAVVESIQKTSCNHLDTHRDVPSISTKFTYDVELGPVGETAKKPSHNRNNNSKNSNDSSKNNNNTKHCGLTSPIHVQVAGDLAVRYGAKIPPGVGQCLLVPRCRSTSDAITRHPVTDARRRRREYAARSALSGDSIAELSRALPPSCLVRRNSDYFVRKRRPGTYHVAKPLGVSGSLCNGINRTVPVEPAAAPHFNGTGSLPTPVCAEKPCPRTVDISHC